MPTTRPTSRPTRGPRSPDWPSRRNGYGWAPWLTPRRSACPVSSPSKSPPFPPLGERFDKLAEQLAILTGLWDTKPGERFSFEGKHYQLKDCASIPRWASRPKIIIGGAGAKRTPTLAAKYADEFNGALGLDLRERYANFKRICEDVVGRDPADIRMSATVPVAIGRDAQDLERRKESLGEPGARLLAAGVTGYAGDVIRVVEDLATQGADTVYFHVYGPSDVAHIELLGEQVVSRFR
jgi:alkanesulfonate monooxygenase SsuD/methylene tetrahydromethanopterin reductase-like flavin-dependent oxidoreductase (luciferase family)